jgi:glutaredoxin
MVSLFLIIGSLLLLSDVQAAPHSQEDQLVTVYFFWGEGCPHCAKAEPFLEALARQYANVQVEAFEIQHHPENLAILKEMAAAYDFEPRYVPIIFVGDEYWEGFAGSTRDEIEAAVEACAENGCPDAGAGIVPGHDTSSIPIEEDCTAEICAAPGADADTEDENPNLAEATPTDVPIYLFWGEGCPQCGTTKSHLELSSDLPQLGSDGGAEALAFLRSLEATYDGVDLRAYDIWGTTTYKARFERIAEAFDREPRGVPTLFIGERVWEGFDEEIADEVEAYVQHCLATGCPDPDPRADAVQPTPTPTSLATPDVPKTASPAETIALPILGKVSLGGQSLWASTALISLADGFNPCSLWVLSILIALTLRTGTRRRTFTIGLIYITVTAGIYVLFIAGLFTLFTLVSFLSWIQAAVSILAIVFAAINIKDYFWYKKGPSLTIADKKKPGIYKRIRRVLNAGDSFWAMAGATVALGAGVSLVEFSCTAGFPVVWTNLVAAQDVPPITFGLLLLLYMVIYQIDELVIFSAAVLTLKASRLEEKHGRMLKLIGGMLMLTLSLVMVFNPSLMNDLGTSLLIFGAAIAASLLVLVVHRYLLPQMGIRIGTELSPER